MNKDQLKAQLKEEYSAMQTLRQVAGMLGVTGNIYKDVPLAVRNLQVRLRMVPAINDGLGDDPLDFPTESTSEAGKVAP